MEQKIQATIDFDQLRRNVTQRRSTKKIFRLPCNLETAIALLDDAYRVEVHIRGGKVGDMECIDEIAKWLISTEKKPFLMLMGNVGNGKTTMAKAIENACNAYLQAFNRVYEMNYNLMEYTTAIDITNLARESETYKDYNKLRQKEMLIIDDLGTESAEIKLYGNILSPMADMLAQRYQDMNMTIITTNLKPSEITERYGERIADRLREVATKIVFKNESYRGK